MSSRKADRRREILDEATRLFQSFGYRKTTLDDVAGAVRIRKSSLYHYFDSKDELFRAVVSDMIGEDRERIRKVMEKEQPLRRILAEYWETMKRSHEQAQPGMTPLIDELSEFYPVIRDIVEDHFNKTSEILEERMRRAVKEGELPEDAPVGDLAVLLTAVQEEYNHHRFFFPAFGKLGEKPERIIDLIFCWLKKAE